MQTESLLDTVCDNLGSPEDLEKGDTGAVFGLIFQTSFCFSCRPYEFGSIYSILHEPEDHTGLQTKTQLRENI